MGKLEPKLKGTVLENYGNLQFKIQFDTESTIRAYLCGKMSKNHIKIIPGDEVIVEIPNGSQIGRIIRRL